MAFRFSLQTVLQFRRSVEHQEEIRLRAIHQALRKVRHQIEQIAAAICQESELSRNEIEGGTTGAEIQFHAETHSALMEQQRRYQCELLRLAKICEQQQVVFNQARKQRETLESLRDRLLRDYETESRRREQRTIDELFLMRRIQKDRG